MEFPFIFIIILCLKVGVTLSPTIKCGGGQYLKKASSQIATTFEQAAKLHSETHGT